LSREPHHGAALVAHQVVGRHAHGETQPRRLPHQLVERVHGLRAAHARHAGHLVDARAQLHAEGQRAQLEHLFQPSGQALEVIGGGGGVGHGEAPSAMMRRSIGETPSRPERARALSCAPAHRPAHEHRFLRQDPA
jgi:hypothetical protein